MNWSMAKFVSFWMRRQTCVLAMRLEALINLIALSYHPKILKKMHGGYQKIVRIGGNCKG